MIVQLVGEMLEPVDDASIVVLVSGVGYQVEVAKSTIGRLKPGETVSLYIRSVTKEDGTQLFGFLEKADRIGFDVLRKIPGIGPAAAMSLLGTIGRERLWKAVEESDLDTICVAPGVGKKLAQRLITELSGRLPKDLLVDRTTPSSSEVNELQSEVLSALLGLGFDKAEISATLPLIPKDASVAQAVRFCLRSMAR
ncbi:MAG: Holliday junction branch migration protein RuvA [Acidimicrobiaceae bacterium]|nr:Holliday junction branch migration protein RuvA [Acidimicrobiaceae bacterium]